MFHKLEGSECCILSGAYFDIWVNHEKAELWRAVQETYLSRDMIAPATAMLSAQLPKMMLYWWRSAHCPILSFVESESQCASSCAAWLSSVCFPMPVLPSVRELSWGA